MEARPATVRVTARRTSAALVVGAVAVAGGVGMGHAFADTGDSVSHACLTRGGTVAHMTTGVAPTCSGKATAMTWSRSDLGNLAVPAHAVHGYAAGLPQFQTISASFTAANFATKFLLCPSATPHVVGGGAQALSPNTAVLNKNYPLSGPVPADGWAAAGYAPYGSQVNLVIYAICTG
jgi:hypothetical protein